MQGALLEIQTAAVGRIKCTNFLSFAGQLAGAETGIGATLGAMAMQDVEFERAGVGKHRLVGFEISKAWLAAHRNSEDAKPQCRGEGGKLAVRQAVFGVAVCKDPDGVALRRLFGCKIENVAEKAADGRAQAM